MKELFNKNQIEQEVQKYHLDINIINKAKEIFKRWHTSVDLTKERPNQMPFLTEFFGDILGYQGIAGKKDNSLWWEDGSVVDGKKPDGILGFNLADFDNKNDIRVVIELKDSTVKLDERQNRKDYNGTPVEQGFRYASKVGGKCEFIIISNFTEIRLYKFGDESKYHSFKLSELAKDDNKIKEFHFLLAKDRLFTKTSNQSPVHALDTTEKGEEIEKRFYKHYSTLREEIWHNLIELNKEKHYGRNFYLYKAQKLIDRIIFIRFCKENGALDNDAVLEALNNKYIKGKYNRMKALFTAMDEGNPEIGIAKFNGGLFATDSDLDNLQVSDDIIDKIVILYAHDFGSDLDVNILGHIFEQSISDLENLTGDNEKKRKKDGVFYTPAYITEYIVKEAIGGWLSDGKAEIKAKENSKDWWQQYAEKLQSIKVLDPACGSGAFLVKVFDYLQNEWREVQKHIKIEWTYKDILTHNIYGVDINPASTGITKLSLWLKTAHYRESLTTLDGNIKIGNSLIDNPDIAGYYSEFEGKVIQEVIAKDLFNASDLEKLTAEGLKKSLAFKWNEEFKEVFEQGGFDVVLGNPPYTYRNAISEVDKTYFLKNYKSTEGNFDLYKSFIEKGINLLKENGYNAFIVPNTFLSGITFLKLREFILSTSYIKHIYDLGLKIFENVVVESVVYNVVKTSKADKTLIKIQRDRDKSVLNPEKEFTITLNDKKSFNIYISSNFEKIIKILENTNVVLGDISYVTVGINTGYIRNELVSDKQINDKYHKLIHSRDIERYGKMWSGEWIIYDTNYVKSFGDRGRTLPPEKIFNNDKILVQRTRRGMKRKLICAFDDDKLYNLNRMSNIIMTSKNYDLKFILALLNSSLFDWYFNVKFNEYEIKPVHLSQLPIPQIPITAQKHFIEKAKTMLALTKQFNELSNKFLKLLSADLGVVKATRKLEKWYNLQADEFFAEVGKQNKNLSLSQKSQWLDHFEAEKQKALALQNQITKTDAEIDKMVYALYGLSEEEIGVVEGLAI